MKGDAEGMSAGTQGRSRKGYDFEDGTDKIIGACLEVHRELGPGFQEIVYQRALALEFEVAGIEFAREEKVPIYYKGKQIDTKRVDFLIEGCIVETKAKSEFAPEDFIQTLSYLKASGYERGLLVNFGAQRLEIKRLVNTNREGGLNREGREGDRMTRKERFG